MELTAAKKKIVEDAKAKGYSVLNSDNKCAIYKKHAGHGRITRGIVIHQNGTAMDLMSRLDTAKGMRAHKDMRSVLGI